MSISVRYDLRGVLFSRDLLGSCFVVGLTPSISSCFEASDGLMGSVNLSRQVARYRCDIGASRAWVRVDIVLECGNEQGELVAELKVANRLPAGELF